MSVTAYKMLSAKVHDPSRLEADVETQIGNSYQPLGAPFAVGDTLYQAMILGVQDSNSLSTDAAAVLDGDTLAIKNSAGADSHNATATVASNAISAIKFAATVAMVDNADTVTVHNSAGSSVAGTHTAEVALGVLTDVKLASTVAAIVNGGTLTGVTPTGVYATTVTFTVASGVITAIALS